MCQLLKTSILALNANERPQLDVEGTLEVTGHLGDVMKESMRCAHTVAKSVLAEKFPDNDFLERGHIHVHVPEVELIFF